VKIVINACFGGFSLSPRAVKRLAELKGRYCFFFVPGKDESGHLDIHKHEPITLETLECSNSSFFYALDIPNPDTLLSSQRCWGEMTMEERRLSNEEWSRHSIEQREIKRTDLVLIQVVEELGPKANGRCAELKIIEIPDGTDWEIDEYDGMESVHETHRAWS
jgi:hypothetical protein